MPFTSRKRCGAGTSITRPSIKNSRRYLRTSGTSGESGVPRFISKTPVNGVEAIKFSFVTKRKDSYLVFRVSMTFVSRFYSVFNHRRPERQPPPAPPDQEG